MAQNGAGASRWGAGAGRTWARSSSGSWPTPGPWLPAMSAVSSAQSWDDARGLGKAHSRNPIPDGAARGPWQLRPAASEKQGALGASGQEATVHRAKPGCSTPCVAAQRYPPEVRRPTGTTTPRDAKASLMLIGPRRHLSANQPQEDGLTPGSATSHKREEAGAPPAGPRSAVESWRDPKSRVHGPPRPTQ